MKINTSLHRGTKALLLGVVLGSSGLALSLATPRAQAQGNKVPSVQADLKAFKLVGNKLVEASTAGPGDVIEYQARYTNTGDGVAQRFAPQLPIPGALVYVGDSAAPDNVLASTDGKNFSPAPLSRRVVGADGKTRLVAVPLREYRALRWQMGALAPGQSVTIKARARVKAFSDGR